MLRARSVLVLSCHLLCALAAWGAPVNLILNGDFEGGNTGSPDFMPLYWTPIGSISRLALVTPPASHNSSAVCVRLTNSGNPNDTEPGYSQQSAYTFAANTIYHLDADFRLTATPSEFTQLKLELGYVYGSTFNVIASKQFEVADYPDDRWQTRMLEHKTAGTGSELGQWMAARFTKITTASVLFWKLDETSGATALDSAKIPHNGTVSGASWSTGGQYGGCLSFDGVNDYISLNPGSWQELDPRTQSWTLSLWFKIPTAEASAFRGLANKGNAGSTDPGWMLWTSGGTLYFRVCESDAAHDSTAISTTVPTDNAWHQILCVVDRSTNTLKGYIDGNGWTTTNVSLATVNNIAASSNFEIGRRIGGPYAKGFIDHVEVIPLAVTPTTVLAANGLYVDNVRLYTPNFIAGPHGAILTTSPGAPDFDISGTPSYHYTWHAGSSSNFPDVTPARVSDDGRLYMNYYNTPYAYMAVNYVNTSPNTYTDLGSNTPLYGGLTTCWYARCLGLERIFRCNVGYFEWFSLDTPAPTNPTWTAATKNFTFTGEPPISCINLPFSQTLLSAREVYSGNPISDSKIRTFTSPDGENWYDGVAMPDPSGWSAYLYRLPCLIISPDGDQMMILAGMDGDDRMTRMWLSKDSSGTSWADPQRIAGQVGGDRAFVGYTEDYASDGRLVVQFRNILAPYPTDPNRFDVTVWVGRFDDLAYGRPGQYRVKLWDYTGDWYGGMTVVPGTENKYQVYHRNTRTEFKLSDFDPTYFATLGSQLLWHQKMDETSGSYVNDSSQCSKWGPNPYGGKIGGTWSTGGKYGGCLSFNGTSDYAYANTQGWEGFEPGQRDWTISFWYKMNPADRLNFYGLISKGNAGSTDPGYFIYMASGKFNFRVHDNATGSQSCPLTVDVPNDSNWHRVVMVINRSTNTMTGYLDLSASTSASISSVGSIESTDVFREGCRSGPSNYFKGSMDDVRIYEKALTTTEIGGL